MWKSSLYTRPNFWCNDDDTLSHIATVQYEKYFKRHQSTVPEVPAVQIPKVLHFIWLGSPFPQKYNRMLDSWRLHHPHWEIIIWDDEKAKTFSMTNRGKNICIKCDYYRNSDVAILNFSSSFNLANFENASNFGMKSDIFRYEILYNIGGVYVDIDYECLKSIDSIVANCEFFVGFSHTEVLEINNGLIGCVRQHDLMNLIINEISKQAFITTVFQSNILAENIAMFMGNSLLPDPAKLLDSNNAVIAQTGPGLLTGLVYQYLSVVKDTACNKSDRDLIVLFPVAFFHPVPNHCIVELETINEHTKELKKRGQKVCKKWT